MTLHEYVCQPHGGLTNRHLFVRALESGNMDRFDVAVAYATTPGVRTLVEIMTSHASNEWEKLKKRWIVGIDWCRSDPTALDLLAAINRSTLKIFDGTRVIARRNCTPKVPFHPKGFILRGQDATAVIVGSGNLSRNGLSRGHEIGSILACGMPRTTLETSLSASCDNVCSWFDWQWKNADDFSTLRNSYLRRYESSDNLKSPPPTEDDAIPSDEPTADRIRRGSLAVEQIRKLRASRHFWIRFVTNPNRGIGVPGNQLMMSRMTRVFFGFPAEELPRDSHVGDVQIQFGARSDAYSLRFSNNAMDVLNLPVPGRGGPSTYDDRVLLFERQAQRGIENFVLTLGDAREIRGWERRSEQIDGSYHMTSGRPWGVF